MPWVGEVEARADSLTHHQKLRGDVELSGTAFRTARRQVGCALTAPHKLPQALVFRDHYRGFSQDLDSAVIPAWLMRPVWMRTGALGANDRAVCLHRPIHVLPESFSGHYGLHCVP